MSGVSTDQLFVMLTVAGEPKSKARPRFTTRGGKVVAYTPKDTTTAEARYKTAYLEQTRRINTDSLGAYIVHADFYNGTYQRRDVDNMLKAVLDGLNKVAWDDDAQVVEVLGRKHFVDKAEARTEVRIYRDGELRQTNIPCANCGAQVKTYPSTRHAQVYCSKECELAKRRADRTKKCEQCGSVFESHGSKRPTRFCSRECAYESQRVIKPCTRCGVDTSVQKCHARKNVYCSDACRRAELAERKRNAPRRSRGTCQVCGGGVSRKEYKRCVTCKNKNLKAAGNPKPATA